MHCNKNAYLNQPTNFGYNGGTWSTMYLRCKMFENLINVFDHFPHYHIKGENFHKMTKYNNVPNPKYIAFKHDTPV